MKFSALDYAQRRQSPRYPIPLNYGVPVSILLTILLVLPLGPLLYRIVFQPIATAPVLVLLMVAVALHFAISGLALLYFGPEGLRTQAFVRGDVSIAGFDVSKQLLLIVGAAALFSAILYVFFQFTLNQDTGTSERQETRTGDGTQRSRPGEARAYRKAVERPDVHGIRGRIWRHLLHRRSTVQPSKRKLKFHRSPG